MGTELSEELMRAALYLQSRSRHRRPDRREPTSRAHQGRWAPWMGNRPHVQDAGISGAKGRDQRPGIQPDAQGRRAASLRRVYVLVNRPARQEGPARRQRHGRIGCCRRRPVQRSAGDRQHQPVALRQGHDPDGVRVRRTGKEDDPGQSSRRG